jgi:hypothetical protein
MVEFKSISRDCAKGYLSVIHGISICALQYIDFKELSNDQELAELII